MEGVFKTQDFNFDLPNELIANKPCFPRDESKMLIYQDYQIKQSQSKNLAQFLSKGDILVLNDSKVLKAKISGFNKNGAKININLHQEIKDGIWQIFAKPAKRLNINDKFIISDDFYGLVIDKNSDGIITLDFNVRGMDFFRKLEKYGQMPLPPYIKTEDKNANQNYQTIYANKEGSVAAPTAGLHFTEELLHKIRQKGVKIVFVTLNVGAGTFLPVKSKLIKDHKMHQEFYEINQESCDIINKAKQNSAKIIAVGTTSMRVLESASNQNGFLEAKIAKTDIFISPGYKFKIVDILMTNFHLPKSTLFMLVSAFIGLKEAKKLYQFAIDYKYRFYSYGDCCLLHQNSSLSISI
jgi:S-adenosylmethionine:tRNA ribosyltransferase-isomerase